MARQETHSEDLPKRVLPPIGNDLQDDPRYALGGEEIVSDELELISKEYLDELAFMQEVLKVMIYKGREKNAPMFVPLGVNGKLNWFPVEQEIPMKRCFVEVLARAQPMDVETKIEDEQAEHPVNKILRSTRSLYPFTVTHDPNPKGPAWLAKVMREN